MTEERILFDKFELPRLKGLEYLQGERKADSDYLFVNDKHDAFSIYFESGMQCFKLPAKGQPQQEYCFFEVRRANKILSFFSPRKNDSLKLTMWYFYVELFDENGTAHRLPGQLRVRTDPTCLRTELAQQSRLLNLLGAIKLINSALAL